MIDIKLFNDNVIIKKEMTLLKVKMLLDKHNFCLTKTEGSLIYHGEAQFSKVEKSIVHLYFDVKTEIIQYAVIHTFPINFDLVQNCLISYYGKPTEIKSDKEALWQFDDSKIVHSIINRYGDEEGIYFDFYAKD